MMCRCGCYDGYGTGLYLNWANVLGESECNGFAFDCLLIEICPGELLKLFAGFPKVPWSSGDVLILLAAPSFNIFSLARRPLF